MLRRIALAGALIASASCNKSEGDSAGPPVPSAGSQRAPAPGGSFSTDLEKELAAPPTGAESSGSGSAARAVGGSAAGSAGGIGSAAKPAVAAAVDKAAPAAGADKPAASDKAAGADKPAASDKAGADKPAAASDKSAAGAKAGGDPKLASADPAPANKPGAPAAPVAPAAAEPSEKVIGAPAHGPAKVSGDLAAIKLSLLPNWDRDIDRPGTFQYVVRIKGTQSTKTFTFHYGYDDPKAPPDREQYKKYLQDNRTMVGDIRDRQRGAAWFLEGSDPAGMPSFRYVVLYGGKRLICYGSLYKDADSNRLGDDRDQTLIQAKQICESLAL